MVDDIKVGWIPLDVPDRLALQDRYEGYMIGEIAKREDKHPLDVLLDISVWGGLKSGFETSMIATSAEAIKEIATASVSLPGVSGGGAHTKFVTTGRYPTDRGLRLVEQDGAVRCVTSRKPASRLTVHAGFEDGYKHVDNAVAGAWGIDMAGQSGTMVGKGEVNFSSK